MADQLTSEQRSRLMSRVRHSGTAPEMRLRKALWSAGLRYRVKNRLPGHPDIVFNGARVAIFVDGCFWHGCPDHGTWPKTNQVFWKAKINRNMERDKEVDKKLRKEGWSVLRFWEHEVKNDLGQCVTRIKDEVDSGKTGETTA